MKPTRLALGVGGVMVLILVLLVKLLLNGATIATPEEPSDVAGLPRESTAADAGREFAPVRVESSTASPLEQVRDHAEVVTLLGTVVEKETGAGVEGALVTFFEAQGNETQDIEREPKFLISVDYELASGVRRRARAPLPRKSPDGGVWRMPQAPESWYAETHSGQGGRFTLEVPPLGGVLMSRAEAGMCVKLVKLSSRELDVRLELTPTHWLLGRVFTEDGGAPLEPVPLAFTATDDSGSWSCVAAAGTGLFECEVGEVSVVPSTHSVRWMCCWPVVAWDAALQQEVSIAVRRRPMLSVTDSLTRGPIEVCSMRLEIVDTGSLSIKRQMSGVNGEYPLVLRPALQDNYDGLAFRLQVWTEEHAIAVVEGIDLWNSSLLEVRLEPAAERPSLTGVLIGQKDRPIAGHSVRLLSVPRGTLMWNVGQMPCIAEGETSGSGHFELTAPEGEYFLSTNFGGDITCTQVTVPSHVIIREEQLGSVECSVNGGRVGQAVILDDGFARRLIKKLDEDKMCRFGALDEGAYTVSLPDQGRPAWKVLAPGEGRSVEVLLAKGGREEVVLTAQVRGERPPLRAVILADTMESEWNILGPDGHVIRQVVPGEVFDVAVKRGNMLGLQPKEDTSQITWLGVPASTGDVWQIELCGVRALAWRCRVPDGSVLAGLSVDVYPSSLDWFVSTTTDQEGRIGVAVLPCKHYVLSFSRDERYQGLSVETASPDPGPVEVVLPNKEDLANDLRAVGGRVLLDGRPMPGAFVVIEAVVWWHGTKQYWKALSHGVATGMSGDFEVRVVGSDRYRATVNLRGRGRYWEEWQASSGAESVHRELNVGRMRR